MPILPSPAHISPTYNWLLVTSAAMASIPKSSSIDDDGGKIIPSPAFPATMVVARSVLQPLCFIQGIVIDPTAEAFPDPEPDTMPNRALAIVDTYPEPPGQSSQNTV